MGRAGLHGRGPHREASVIGQDLHVAAEGLVLTRVPQVVAGLGAGCDPVSAHQGAVQADERLASAPEPVQDVSDIGRPLGDDLQGLMQVPVGGGLPDLTWLIVGWLGCWGLVVVGIVGVAWVGVRTNVGV